MLVELIDGRYAGQMRDLDPGAAQDLIDIGRAKSFMAPTPATPPLPGGYSGTPARQTEAPLVHAIGGIVESGVILVGEHVVDHVIARPTAEKLTGKKKNR
jgi:hypothetical protein